MDRGAWWATVHGVTESDTTKELTLSPSSKTVKALIIGAHLWVPHDAGKYALYLHSQQNRAASQSLRYTKHPYSNLAMILFCAQIFPRVLQD